MSRLAQPGAVSPKRSAAEDGEPVDACPVCKARPWLNKKTPLVFMINPECYHKMCQACVERIFSRGPARCPVAGCQKTLRKAKFRPQKFEDLRVEREVDIRTRIGKIFNRREEDFETVMDYNNYLNEVEDITFNLINRIDVEETERKLRAYAEQYKNDISSNESLARQEAMEREEHERAEAEQALRRRRAAQQEDEEARRARMQARNNVIDQLAFSDGHADQIAEEGRVVLKKSLAQRTALRNQQRPATPDVAGTSLATPNGAADGFVIRGLKKRVAPAPEKPYDPFDGITAEPEYFVLQDHYNWDWLDNAQRDARHNAGGYDMKEYYQRALCDAFSGFGIFVGEEVAGREVASAASVATTGAAVAAVNPASADVKMEDVF